MLSKLICHQFNSLVLTTKAWCQTILSQNAIFVRDIYVRSFGWSVRTEEIFKTKFWIQHFWNSFSQRYSLQWSNSSKLLALFRYGSHETYPCPTSWYRYPVRRIPIKPKSYVSFIKWFARNSPRFEIGSPLIYSSVQVRVRVFPGRTRKIWICRMHIISVELLFNDLSRWIRRLESRASLAVSFNHVLFVSLTESSLTSWQKRWTVCN